MPIVQIQKAGIGKELGFLILHQPFRTTYMRLRASALWKMNNGQKGAQGRAVSSSPFTPQMFARNPVFSAGEQLLQVVDFFIRFYS